MTKKSIWIKFQRSSREGWTFFTNYLAFHSFDPSRYVVPHMLTTSVTELQAHIQIPLPHLKNRTFCMGGTGIGIAKMKRTEKISYSLLYNNVRNSDSERSIKKSWGLHHPTRPAPTRPLEFCRNDFFVIPPSAPYARNSNKRKCPSPLDVHM